MAKLALSPPPVSPRIIIRNLGRRAVAEKTVAPAAHSALPTYIRRQPQVALPPLDVLDPSKRVEDAARNMARLASGEMGNQNCMLSGHMNKPGVVKGLGGLAISQVLPGAPSDVVEAAVGQIQGNIGRLAGWFRSRNR